MLDMASELVSVYMVRATAMLAGAARVAIRFIANIGAQLSVAAFLHT